MKRSICTALVIATAIALASCERGILEMASFVVQAIRIIDFSDLGRFNLRVTEQHRIRPRIHQHALGHHLGFATSNEENPGQPRWFRLAE